MTDKPHQTNIVNVALSHLGSRNFLGSLDEGGEIADQVNAHWSQITGYCLAAHPWNFALRRATLNKSNEVPAFGWPFKYQLPADCIRWLPPAKDNVPGAAFDGEQEGRFLLTDREEPLHIRYISNDVDIADWPQEFAAAVSLKLAAALAESITQSRTTSESLSTEADMMLSKAKRLDGLSTGRRERTGITVRSNWLTARKHGRSHIGR